MSAVTQLSDSEWIRLGALVVRHDLNHRDHRNTERINEYVRMLEKGENPPPILVHRATNVVVNGLHRFYAAKQFAYATQRKWQEALIEVQWTDETPDPESEPLLFAVRTAAENRHNGEPLDRRDVLRLVGAVVKQYGKEKGRECALQMNESNASFEEFYRSLYPPASPPGITTRDVSLPGQAPKFLTGEFMNIPTAEDTTPTRSELIAPVARPPGPQRLGELRSSRPPIMSACRMLREAVKEAAGDFTDAEKSELEDVFFRLKQALNH